MPKEVSWRAIKESRFQLELWGLPTVLTVLVLTSVIWLFTVYRRNPTFFEKVIGAVLIGLFLLSVAQFVRALLLLHRSGNALEKALKDQGSWCDLPTTTVDRMPTWFSKVIAAANVRAEIEGRDSRESDIQGLPAPEELIAPARAAAEKAAILLRWFSTTAVLVGLIGTFYGLIDAVGGALHVLDASGATDLQGASFAKALGPLQFCFVSSIAGVATSFALGLLRLVYEADLDAHFAELGFALSVRIRDFYPNWQSPETRLVTGMADLKDAAAGLRSVGQDMSQLGTKMTDVVGSVEKLAKQIEETTSQALKQTVAIFSEQLVHQLPKITEGVNKGLDEGTSKILAQLLRQEDDARTRLANRAQEFSEKLGGVQKALEASSEAIGKNLEVRSKEFLDTALTSAKKVTDAVSTQAGNVIVSHQKAMDDLVTAAREVGEKVSAAADSAGQAAAAVGARLGDLQASSKAIGDSLGNVSEKVQKAGVDLASVMENMPKRLDESREKIESALITARDTYASTVKAAFDDAGKSVVEAANRVGTVAQSASRVLDEVPKTMAPVSDALRGVTATAQEISRVNTALRDRVGEDQRALKELKPVLDGVRDAIAQQVNAVVSATAGFRKALEVTDEEARAVESALHLVRNAHRANGKRDPEAES